MEENVKKGMLFFIVLLTFVIGILFFVKTQNENGGGFFQNEPNWQWEDDWGVSPDQIQVQDFEEAKKQSFNNGKDILVVFKGDNCVWCSRLEKTMQQERVSRMMPDYILVKLDVSENSRLANQYKVRGIPVVLLVDSDGQVLKRNDGYMSPEKMAAFLKD